MSSYLRAPLLRLRALRPAPTFSPLRASSTFQSSPSPPRLPADQQAEFERLQREAEARLSSHVDIPAASDATPAPSPASTSRHATTPDAPAPPPPSITPEDAATGPSAGSFSGGIRQGAPPEFEGEVNPKTGEVGGPKNEPLRWGGAGDWSYNGRVTDF